MAAVSPTHPEPIITAFRIGPASPARLGHGCGQHLTECAPNRRASDRPPTFPHCALQQFDVTKSVRPHLKKQTIRRKSPPAYGRGKVRGSHQAFQHADGGREAELFDSRTPGVRLARPK